MTLGPEGKRVMIALDTGSLSHAAIEAAARLAIGLRAELEALFVENANLERLAGLPFATEFGATSAQPRRFDLAGLERAFSVQALQVRRALENAARKLPLSWTLEVVRGDLVAVALERTGDADLLVLGRTGPPARRSARAGTILPRPERRSARRPIVVMFDGSAAGGRALEAALALERRAKANVLVAIPAADPEQYSALRRAAAAELAASRRDVSGYLRLPDSRVDTLGEATRRANAGALLLPAIDMARAQGEFQALVDRTACPVVLIR